MPDGLAQRVDVGDAALVGDRDFAVQDQRRQPGRGQWLERLAEQRSAVAPVAAQEPQRAAGDNGEQPVPIVLDLVQPAGIDRRLGTGGDDLQSNLARQSSGNRRTR